MLPQSKKWQLAPSAPPDHLARFPDLHPVLTQLLFGRGVTDPQDAARFLARQNGAADPFDLAGMEAAVTRIRRALAGEERIAVYGDFDVSCQRYTADR